MTRRGTCVRLMCSRALCVPSVSLRQRSGCHAGPQQVTDPLREESDEDTGSSAEHRGGTVVVMPATLAGPLHFLLTCSDPGKGPDKPGRRSRPLCALLPLVPSLRSANTLPVPSAFGFGGALAGLTAREQRLTEPSRRPPVWLPCLRSELMQQARTIGSLC